MKSIFPFKVSVDMDIVGRFCLTCPRFSFYQADDELGCELVGQCRWVIAHWLEEYKEGETNE